MFLQNVGTHLSDDAGPHSGAMFLKLGFAALQGSAKGSGVPRDEDAYWRKSFIDGPKLVCVNESSCDEIRH
jgi:hypothetical protein